MEHLQILCGWFKKMLVKVICMSSSCEPGRMKRFFSKNQTFEMENKNKAFQSSSICVCIYLVICLLTYFIFVVPEVCIPNAELFFRLPAKGGHFFTSFHNVPFPAFSVLGE